MKNLLHINSIGLIIVIAFGGLWGCEQTFEPLSDNDAYNYTMYGVLDLSADTQWVRVMPIRTTIFRDSVPNEATVSLTRISTGETTVLEDSLFKLAQNSFVWNFWTDISLQPNESYRLEAESPEGEITFATAHIPADFPDPLIFYRDNTDNCHVEISPLAQYIPVAQINYRFRVIYQDTSDFFNFPISHVGGLTPGGRGNSEIIVTNDIQTIASEFDVSTDRLVDISAELTVVSADSNWYDMDVLGAEIPGQVSNVENGLGVVTGIVSKKLPFRPNREDQLDYMFCPPEYADQ